MSLNVTVRSRSCGCIRGFIAQDKSLPAARVVDWISVPLGVATLRDQFNDVEDDAARFALMSWFFEENLSGFSPYHDTKARDRFQIVGTSGTVTTVAASHLGLNAMTAPKWTGCACLRRRLML